MSYKPRTEKRGVSKAVAVSAAVLTAAALLLIFLFIGTPFVPLLQTALLLLLPGVINVIFLLLCPIGKSDKGGAASEAADVKRPEPVSASADAVTETSPTRKAWLRELPKRCKKALKRLVHKHRVLLKALLLVALLITANVFFWRYARTEHVPVGAVSYPAYYHVVLLAVLFVLFVALGKWCKHASPELNVDRAEAARYELSLLRNLQSAFAIGRAALLLTATVVTLKLVGVYDFSKWLVLLISLLFAYQTVFMVISLVVVLVRRELEKAPEITAPMIGVESGDLGLLSYLEKNTGITMRSLWSMQLIKLSLPYAALLAVLLLWGATGITLVESHQEGAHYRMGRLQTETLAPGLHVTLPWPLDRVEVYDTATVNGMTIGYVSEGDADNLWTEAHGTEEYRLLLGGGNELVSVNLRILYRIGDLRAYLTSTASPELLMSSAAYELVTLHTIELDLNTMLSTDREQFAAAFKEKLAARIAPYQTGIEITDIVLESIHPPVEVADVYQALISADIQAERILLNAKSYYIQVVGFSEVQVQDLLADAEIEKLEMNAEAKAAVAEFKAMAELDAAYYCNGTDCHALMTEKKAENGDSYYACKHGHRAENNAALKPVSAEYRYYKYMQAISQAYGDAKLIIVGDGVNAGNIYIGKLPAGN